MGILKNSTPVRIDAQQYLEANTLDYIRKNIFDPDGPGVVYFVETKYHGYCKIGITSPNGFDARVRDWLFADIVMTTWMHDPMPRLSAFLLEQCLLKITSDFAFAPYYVAVNKQPGFTELRRLPKGAADLIWQRIYLLSKLFYDVNTAKEDCVLDFLSTPSTIDRLEKYKISSKRHCRSVDDSDYEFEYKRMANFIFMTWRAFSAAATKHPFSFISEGDDSTEYQLDGFCFRCGFHPTSCLCSAPRLSPQRPVVRSIPSPLAAVPI